MRERREIPKIEGGEVGLLMLGEGMGELLEALQCSWLTHFGDGGRDGGVAGDSLSGCRPYLAIDNTFLMGRFRCQLSRQQPLMDIAGCILFALAFLF
jgi:hypothetical protein